MRSAYITKYYEHSEYRVPPGIPFMWALWVAFTLGYLYSNVNLQDVTWKHTYHEPYNNPGTLRSMRQNAIWWTTFAVGLLRWGMSFLTFVRVTAYRNTWVINFHLIMSLLFLLGETANAIVLGLEIQNCNEEPNNMCNDDRFCGAVNFIAITDVCPQNFCPANETIPFYYPYDPPVAVGDLTWNVPFTILFALSLIHLAAGLLIFWLSFNSRNPSVLITDKISQEPVNGNLAPVGSRHNARSVENETRDSTRSMLLYFPFSNCPLDEDFIEESASDSEELRASLPDSESNKRHLR